MAAKKKADMTPAELKKHEARVQNNKRIRESARRLAEKSEYKTAGVTQKPFIGEYEGQKVLLGGTSPALTPERIIEKALEYFQWNEENPIVVEEQNVFKGHVTRYDVEKPRAMTIGRVCLRLGVCHQTWRNYQAREDDEVGRGADYRAAIDWVENIIRAQKIEGAAVGLFNPMIICRELGLKDSNKVVTDDGEGGDAPITGPVAFLPSNGREVLPDA